MRGYSAGALCGDLFLEKPLVSTLAGVYMREAKVSDATEIEQFIIRMRSLLGVAPDTTADARPLFNDIHDFENSYKQNGRFYVLTDDDGKIIGTVGYFQLNNYVCELKKFYLDPSLQGRGAGKAFLNHIISKSKQMGFKKMILQTNPSMAAAIGLYTKMGFTQFSSENSNNSAAYYELNLTP